MQVETLMDLPIFKALTRMGPEKNGRRTIPIRRLIRAPVMRTHKSVTEVVFNGYTIKELETGSIEVLKGDQSILPVKPLLRELAVRFNVGLLNGNGNPLNTRQLGSQIIKSVQELGKSMAQQAVQADSPAFGGPAA
jgi:hypothetical protein